jgi:Protein of unknown function (DUF4239)
MSDTDWRAYDHYAYAALAVFGTLVAILAVDWLMVWSPWTEWVRSLAGVSAPFMNVVGVLFGLTLAFLANDTWTAHDRAMSAVLREADSIRSLAILCRALSQPIRDEVEAALVAYARGSVAEWPQLARRACHPAAGRDGDRLLSLVAAPSVNAGVGNTVQQLMLGQVVGIRVSREQRIGLCQTHVNPLKWLGMAFLGLLTLLSLAVIYADNPRAATIAMVLFGLAAAPTAAIVLIHGNPFQPPSAVSPAPIAEALSPQRS